MVDLPAPERRGLPERVRASTAASITGLSLRCVQSLAAQRKIPGSAKLGGAWTFDVAKLRRWIAQREAEGCPEISTAAGQYGGRGFKLPDMSIDEAYERAIGLKPGSASRRGSQKSTGRRSSATHA